MAGHRGIHWIARLGLGIAWIALGARVLLGQQADSRAPAPSEETQAKARQLVEQVLLEAALGLQEVADSRGAARTAPAAGESWCTSPN